MAKIDKFLSAMMGRGAPVLRLDPGEVPILELPGGHRTTLNNQELLGAVLDGLAKEILPEALETSYLRGEKVQFDYSLEGERFHLLLVRTNLGTRMVVGRTGPVAALEGKVPRTSVGRIETLVQRALKDGASDLYLSIDEPPALRREGHVESLQEFAPLGVKDLEECLKPWIPSRNQDAFQQGQDTEFSRSEPGLPCRVRVSLMHDAGGPAAALRFIPRKVPDPSELGLPDPVRRLAGLNRGLVLLTGPLGSGKTTTLASLLESARQNRRDFILGIHDSIEFDLGRGEGLSRQRETGREARRQHQALRAALRQAPDILVLDELRDPEGVELLLQAAHAGQVVFATLGSSTLLDTLSFLIHGFLPEEQARVRARLAACLKAVVGHTLLRRAGGGRVVALETLFTTPAQAEHLREGRLAQVVSTLKQGRYGQSTQNDALLDLIQKGLVDPLEAYRRCQDRESFIAACKKAGLPFDPRREGTLTTEH